MPVWNHSFIASTKEAAAAELANRTNIPAAVRDAISASIASLANETGRSISVATEGETAAVATGGATMEVRIRRAHSDVRSVQSYA